MTLKEQVQRMLSRHDGRCLDDKKDRRKVELAILNLFKKEERRRCTSCDHMDEVHNTDYKTGQQYCLGGPLIDCHCVGFNIGFKDRGSI
jgi:hypothetical protein